VADDAVADRASYTARPVSASTRVSAAKPAVSARRYGSPLMTPYDLWLARQFGPGLITMYSQLLKAESASWLKWQRGIYNPDSPRDSERYRAVGCRFARYRSSQRMAGAECRSRYIDTPRDQGGWWRTASVQNHDVRRSGFVIREWADRQSDRRPLAVLPSPQTLESEPNGVCSADAV
jgi:hypothetical protein